MSRPRPLVLIVLDGWGLGRKRIGNAIYQAKTPFFHSLQEDYSVARLKASGEAVGLPEGQMGNSEVGHLNIGAGRIVYQELTRISKSIEDGDFFENKELLAAIRHVKNKGSALHLLGLLSDGGVHSHNTHLYALLELAKSQNVDKVYVHAVLDGRDVGPTSAEEYLSALEDKISDIGVGKVATVSGRYFTMDRDKRWERVERAYRSMVYGTGEAAATSLHALENAYEHGETDEFVAPTVILEDDGQPVATIGDDDAVIFFNFRPDRARQITRTFTDSDFAGFERGESAPYPYFVCMTQYDERIDAPVAFPPDHPTDTLGEVLAAAGLKQLRIAETEKYAHVTFFFSGGEEKCFDGEERILIPSPKVPTYNLQPEMSAPEVTDRLLEEIAADKFDVVIINYANPDMVGHTGVLEAAVKAVETVDSCLSRVVPAVLEKGGVAIVTADHGNAEQMTSGRNNRTFTAHTPNPVPFILAAKDYRLKKQGILADVAPTVLDILNLETPAEMTGSSLLIRADNRKKK
ncbi:2,3-bisphosphoglycerate-independent phosphoglycerate mutase [Dethiobacter alkaliphilus]|uniref:2,3-bisphosphoglycerate-independent phosphoglycerate mutase n=1 Tax=Dethiobacter alkaliphilus AHT 1 TaxID=555088 RepID=C0GFB5_DETAL|nr:2,3-bisphosphoglycerate-independent phosphoglycerate mutase [Dethiobacter alkaliphilus]EEG77875.1 phosphoglycerate mutase, 2,3-bisphosphoglycerate-independent [Dethiobacter alkaliphilus AHT 1]